MTTDGDKSWKERPLRLEKDSDGVAGFHILLEGIGDHDHGVRQTLTRCGVGVQCPA